MNNLYFSRRAAPPTEKMIWLGNLSEFRGAFLIVPVFVAMFAMMFSRQYWETRDHADSPMQFGHALVRSKQWIAGEEGRSGGWDMTVQLNGQTVTPDWVDLDHVDVGDTVSVMYRTGRSGHIYVSKVYAIERSVTERVGTDRLAR